MSKFNHHAFHTRRRLLKGLGLCLVIGGVFAFVDQVAEEPIPLTGMRAEYAGAVLVFVGLLALYHGYKLPLAEALDLIHERGRGVTESELIHDMRVDRATAGRIIGALIRKGFLRPATSEASQAEAVYEPVR